MQGKITISAVKALKQGETLWDTEIRGLGVRRQLRDAIYTLKTRIEGRARWITIGPHGSPWTPEKARAKAKQLLGEIADGTDVAALRDDEKTAPTVKEFCKRYLDDADKGLVRYRGKPKKASTLKIDRGRVDRHINPLLGSKLLKNITTGDIEKFMHDVAEGATKADFKPEKKHARVRVTGGTGTATRTVALLSSIFSYAIKKRLITDNPVRGVEKYAYGKRDRTLTPDEWEAFEQGINIYAAKGGNTHAINIARLLAFTGARRDEIVSLKRSEVDLELRVLDLPETKSGHSVRPLGNAARDILVNLLKEPSDNEYIFPSETVEGAYQGFPRAWKRILKFGELDGITPHTLRHTFATIASVDGFSDSTISALIGHKARNVTQRYIHRRVDRTLLAAADQVSGQIERTMKKKKTAKVVAFPAG